MAFVSIGELHMIFVYIFGLRNSNMLPLGWPATCCHTNKPTKTSQMYDVVFPAAKRGMYVYTCVYIYIVYTLAYIVYT